MNEQLLFFKDKIIHGNDLEIIFHKDFVWIYDDKPMPVVIYSLTNCKDLAKVDFTYIDVHNDGIIVETRQQNNQSFFETSDMGNVKVTIVCDKIVKREQDYRKEDFIDLLKEFQKQRDDEYETVKMLSDRVEDLKKFLDRELNISERKRNQADWLSEDKKHFLEGQQEILKKVIEVIKKREQEDFQKRNQQQTLNS
ncbi:hypothetical protein [Parasediminibacterium sp. JCM 36343]|uniref:hypothetical protein n=1 Tax=Parasediminibacterium sp. JCM 36343 TaxID=3374279 RepID=UPI00397E7588